MRRSGLRVVPMLKAPGRMTRSRAFVVLRRIVPRLDGRGDWQSLWVEFGRYLPAAEQPQRNAAGCSGMQRDAAADRWIAWVERQTL